MRKRVQKPALASALTAWTISAEARVTVDGDVASAV